MAALYIKYAKKCEKMFFLQIINGHGPFWPGGWLRQYYLLSRQKSINIMVGSWSGLIL